jgi:hypothetical protein
VVSSGNVTALSANAANLMVTPIQSNAANLMVTTVQANASNLLATALGWPLSGVINNGGQTLVNTTSTALTNFSAVASTKNFLTQITVWNYSAVDTYIKFQDGSGGTQFWIAPAPALSGSIQTLSPPVKQPTANTATYIAEGATANGILIAVNGFQSTLG